MTFLFDSLTAIVLHELAHMVAATLLGVPMQKEKR